MYPLPAGWFRTHILKIADLSPFSFFWNEPPQILVSRVWRLDSGPNLRKQPCFYLYLWKTLDFIEKPLKYRSGFHLPYIIYRSENSGFHFYLISYSSKLYLPWSPLDFTTGLLVDWTQKIKPWRVLAFLIHWWKPWLNSLLVAPLRSSSLLRVYENVTAER